MVWPISVWLYFLRFSSEMSSKRFFRFSIVCGLTLPGQFAAGGVFLQGKTENADPFDRRLPGEFQQLGKILLFLARETDDEGAAQNGLGNIFRICRTSRMFFL